MTFDRSRLPPTLAHLSERDWEDLSTMVLEFLLRRTHNRDLASEVAQGTFLLLLTTRPWQPAEQPSLERHLLGIARSTLSHARTNRRAYYERDAASEGAHVGHGLALDPEGMHRAAADEARRERQWPRRLALLRARLASHPLELQLLELTLEGVDEPRELAERTGRRPAEIYRARERIHRHVKAVAASWAIDEDVTVEPGGGHEHPEPGEVSP